MVHWAKWSKQSVVIFVISMRTSKITSFTNDENSLHSFPSKQNTKPTPSTFRSVNFGKSIKLKAQLMSSNSPPLAQITSNCLQNRLNSHISFHPELTQPSKRTFFPDDDELEFKNKTVRFQDQAEFGTGSQVSLQQSQSKRRNPSILKKSPSCDKGSMISGTSDAGLLDCLPPKSSLRDTGGVCSNDKYQKTLKNLKEQNAKYVDSLFPPGAASLCYSKLRSKQFQEIKWARIEDVYRNRKLVLFNEYSASKCVITGGQLDYCRNMGVAFNALANSNRCLQRIFEDQKAIGLCLYYLRINHDGIWKYVVVDDFIPVVKRGGVDCPAFMGVEPNTEGDVQIWPLLLQKCLAKIYNCYQCLFQDPIDNLLYEMTGFPCQTLNLEDESSQFVFRSSLLHAQTVAVVSNPYNTSHFTEGSYAIREDGGLGSSTYFTLDLRMRLLDPERRQIVMFQVGEIKREFKTARIFRIDDGVYSLGCVIKQSKNSISLRKFIIRDRSCNCTLTLVQRDRKYYRNNGYQYVWTRMMILTRDGTSGYRWIDGKYQQGRLLSLAVTLEPGEYFVAVSGDWGARAFEMNLNYQGSQEIEFSRDTLEQHPQMISETCLDLAQRFGQLKQISKNLCAYRLIDQRNGFCIENVNNQAIRSVYFQKEYTVPKFCLLMDSSKYVQEESKEGRMLVETKIEANSHFTFVAKMVEGIHAEKLKEFVFE